MTADDLFEQRSQTLGFPCDDPIKIGGLYSPGVRDGNLIYISGQIPRVGDRVAVIGELGGTVSFEQACFGAQISTLRALALVRQSCGTLDHVISIPRMNVFIRSTPDFTQHSEVADAASRLLTEILGANSSHARTSVGVVQLPKGAAVEIDFIFRVKASIE